MKIPLWTPSEERVGSATMTRFMEFVNRKHAQQFRTYDELYRWSVGNIPEFWAWMWEFGGVIASRGYNVVVDDLNKMPGAGWFVGARLNFAGNLVMQGASGSNNGRFPRSVRRG